MHDTITVRTNAQFVFFHKDVIAKVTDYVETMNMTNTDVLYVQKVNEKLTAIRKATKLNTNKKKSFCMYNYHTCVFVKHSQTLQKLILDSYNIKIFKTDTGRESI